MKLIEKLMESIGTSGSDPSLEVYNEEIFRPDVRNTELQEWPFISVGWNYESLCSDMAKGDIAKIPPWENFFEKYPP